MLRSYLIFLIFSLPLVFLLKMKPFSRIHLKQNHPTLNYPLKLHPMMDPDGEDDFRMKSASSSIQVRRFLASKVYFCRRVTPGGQSG